MANWGSFKKKLEFFQPKAGGLLDFLGFSSESKGKALEMVIQKC